MKFSDAMSWIVVFWRSTSRRTTSATLGIGAARAASRRVGHATPACSISAICSTRRAWRPPVERRSPATAAGSRRRAPRRRCARPSTARWRRCARGTGGPCTDRCTAPPGPPAPCWRRSARPARCPRARCPARPRPQPRPGRRRRRSAGSRPAPRSGCRGRRPRGRPPSAPASRCSLSRKPAWSEPMAMCTGTLPLPARRADATGRRQRQPTGGVARERRRHARRVVVRDHLRRGTYPRPRGP